MLSGEINNKFVIFEARRIAGNDHGGGYQQQNNDNNSRGVRWGHAHIQQRPTTNSEHCKRTSCSQHSCKSHSDIVGADGETNLNSMKDEIIRFGGNWRRLRMRLALIVPGTRVTQWGWDRIGLNWAWLQEAMRLVRLLWHRQAFPKNVQRT